jgi:hypothetical protein
MALQDTKRIEMGWFQSDTNVQSVVEGNFDKATRQHRAWDDDVYG